MINATQQTIPSQVKAYKVGQRVELTNGHTGIITEFYFGSGAKHICFYRFQSDNGSLFTVGHSEIKRASTQAPAGNTFKHLTNRELRAYIDGAQTARDFGADFEAATREWNERRDTSTPTQPQQCQQQQANAGAMRSAPKFNPTDIAVETEHGRTAVSWQEDGARFHVWIDIDTLEVEKSGYASNTPTIFKNPPRDVERHAPGYFDTRKLDARTLAHTAELAFIFAHVKQHGLIEAAKKAEATRREAERVEHEKAVREAKIEAAALDLHEALYRITGDDVVFNVAVNGHLNPGLWSDRDLRDAINRVYELAQKALAKAAA